jgi:hypothetical protein
MKRSEEKTPTPPPNIMKLKRGKKQKENKFRSMREETTEREKYGRDAKTCPSVGGDETETSFHASSHPPPLHPLIKIPPPTTPSLTCAHVPLDPTLPSLPLP